MTKQSAATSGRFYASCSEAAGQDPNDWDLLASDERKAQAVAVCRRCPVYAQCLDDAIGWPPAGLIQAGFAWHWPQREPAPDLQAREPVLGERRTRGVSRHQAVGAARAAGG